jgi:hypothetical protein
VERARALVEQWTDPELRRRGLTLLEVYEHDVQGGQRQLLLRSDIFGNTNAAVDGVFASLRKAAGL